MKNWLIELVAVGRNEISRTVTIPANTLTEAEERAIMECCRHLMSRDVHLEQKTDLSYAVVAGCNAVGAVRIQNIY